MRQTVLLILGFLTFSTLSVSAQTAPKPQASPRPPAASPTPAATFDMAEFGVRIEPDRRLIVVMAALEAAGFDASPGKEPSTFRALLRKDLATLDPDLRARLRAFLERNKLPANATPAQEAARYVSLAYALGPVPTLETPDRSDDLPAGVLEVLDFAPLVQEFYRKSGIDERMAGYIRAYHAEGDRMRKPAGDLVRAILSYLHTRPITVSTERVRVKSPDKKKNVKTATSVVEHERRFFIVPDLLAAPGTINFRIIADDYFTIVPEGTDPRSSELRRGYIQYVVDALVLRNNKEIAARREQIKQLIDERTKAGGTVSPDAFVVVGRSLVAAADVRFEESVRLIALDSMQRLRLKTAKDDAARLALAREAQTARAAIADEAVARLVEEYENGAALAFYFADQLRDISASGFDVGNFFGEMIAGFDPVREAKRRSEVKDAHDRAIAARKAHPYYFTWLVDPWLKVSEGVYGDPRGASLTKSLKEVETLLQTRNYETAEAKLKSLLQEHPGEPRLMFALGQTASLWARDTTDDDLQEQRLNQALANYRFAVQAASPETDRVLLSRAHEAMGRILAFLDRRDEAMKEFEAAIKIGDVSGGAYQNALEGKKKLAQP
jgi:tetratricopeptide (TPR) repeat protein